MFQSEYIDKLHQKFQKPNITSHMGCVKFFALIEKCILKGYTKNGILS